MEKSSVENLIGRNVEIRLFFVDVDTYAKIGKNIPELPTIRGKLIKRVFSWTWCYVVVLTDPLFLNIDGIGEKAQKKYSTRFVFVTPSYTYKNDKDDNIYIRLGKMKEEKINIGVAYIEDAVDVPNELITGKITDPYFEKMPPIAGGYMRLID